MNAPDISRIDFSIIEDIKRRHKKACPMTDQEYARTREETVRQILRESLCGKKCEWLWWALLYIKSTVDHWIVRNAGFPSRLSEDPSASAFPSYAHEHFPSALCSFRLLWLPRFRTDERPHYKVLSKNHNRLTHICFFLLFMVSPWKGRNSFPQLQLVCLSCCSLSLTPVPF